MASVSSSPAHRGTRYEVEEPAKDALTCEMYVLVLGNHAFIRL
jgi:hypothetical protein